MRTHREELAAAFATKDVECFVNQPLVLPDERFHRAVTELLDEWRNLRGSAFEGIRLIGDPASAAQP